MSKELVISALKMAYKRQKPGKGLVHHSDRGVQYASREYQNLLKKYYMTGSMSRKGNCYDNACIESFHGILKRELVYQTKYKTREEAKTHYLNTLSSFTIQSEFIRHRVITHRMNLNKCTEKSLLDFSFIKKFKSL